MFIIVHTFRTVCLSVLVCEHPRRGRVIIRGLLWNQSRPLGLFQAIFIYHAISAVLLNLLIELSHNLHHLLNLVSFLFFFQSWYREDTNTGDTESRSGFLPYHRREEMCGVSRHP